LKVAAIHPQHADVGVSFDGGFEAEGESKRRAPLVQDHVV
jgi:hypothetical protein